MPRGLRIQYPGAIYHVLNRGDQREDIFRDDADREKFLSTLSEACGKAHWPVLRSRYCGGVHRCAPISRWKRL